MLTGFGIGSNNGLMAKGMSSMKFVGFNAKNIESSLDNEIKEIFIWYPFFIW